MTRFICILMPVLVAGMVVFAGPQPMLAVGPIGDMVAAFASAGTDSGEKLLQFTSAHHVLGFTEDGVIVASARHMLRIEFLDSSAVAPEADNDVSGEESIGTARPLNRVTYQNVWDGVTMVYEASGESIVKSTYYLDATEEGVQVDRIRLGYNRPVQIDEKGNLVIAYADGTVIEGAPVAWQETEGGRTPVTVAYVLHGEREVGFALGDYLPGIPVIIDPVMTWNTFMGGASAGSDVGWGIAVDGSGNVYVGGYSPATWGSPLRAFEGGDADAFAAKLNSSGTLQWNTFLGGSGSDYGSAIAVDSSGNVYVSGYSNATWGTPVAGREYTWGYDAFAAKLNSSGALQWNSFLGGYSSDYARRIAADNSGNVYVAGESNEGWGTPVAGREYTSGYDAFAAKLNSSGSLTWNAFLGGTDTDNGRGIAVDGDGNVYVGGQSTVTWGTSPRRNFTSGTDNFAAKLNSSGTLIWHTFLGGTGTDYGYALAVDGSGNVYVAGESNVTWGSPRRAYAALSDAFAVKLDSNGDLTWNTFLGSSLNEFYGNSIAVDSSGNVYAVGRSPAAWESPVRAYYGSGYDTFAVKLNSSGDLTWNTFLGGSGTDYGCGIAVDSSGNVYVGGYSDATWGSPVNAFAGGADVFAAKLDLYGNFVPTWASYNDSDRTVADDTFAAPETTVYMKGTSIASDVSYLVAYYDANGVKRGSETQTAVSGALNGAYLLTSVPSAAAGTWHALVQPGSGYTEFGTESYATIAASPATYGVTADDSFTVESSSIPEFPTVIAGIVVAGLCAVIYWWMRKRRLAYVQA